MTKITMRMAAALAAFLTTGILHAGPQCRMIGTLTDSAGAPIEGVSVIVTTPSLRIFRMAVTTDSKGKYSMILNDCTMPYHVSFEKAGFVAATADEKIAVGDTGTIDRRLLKVSEAKPAGGAAAPAGPSATDQAILAFNSGVEAMNAGDKATAETHFKEAVAKNPDLPAGWQALAQLAYEKKDWAKVLEYGQKAVDLDPSLTKFYSMLAEASKATGDTKAAAEWTAKYAEANPDSPEILYNKGIQAYNKNKWKDAEQALTHAVEAKPDMANAHFYLGLTAYNLNHMASAKEHLQKYLELEPNGKEASTAKEFLTLLK